MAGAGANPPTRACVDGDLDGTYLLVDFRELPARNLTLQAQSFPYYFLAFYPPATWAEQAFNIMPASLAVLLTQLKPQTQRRNYTLESDGRLTLNRGHGVQFVGSCAVSLGAGDGFHENDLVLSGNEAGNPAELHELFRRRTGGWRSFDVRSGTVRCCGAIATGNRSARRPTVAPRRARTGSRERHH